MSEADRTTIADMKLAVFVLNRVELLAPVLEAYVEVGIGATVIDSEGMGRLLTHEVPLFADFQELMQGTAPRNKTILSVIREDAIIKRLLELLDKVCGDLTQPGTGVFFTTPVDLWRGPAPREG